MKKLEGYMAGANLGHWLSQYGSKSDEHWSTYITEPDIARMRGWGLDHVRVPVDYFLFERDEEPGVYDEKRLAYIDRTLEWCRKNGMNMILDLHHAPGFFFGNGAKNDLFTSEASRKRYLDIWRMFAERYSSEGDNLIFELLKRAGLGEFRPVERSLAGDGGGDTQDIACAPDNCRRKLLEQRERVTKSRADRRRADNLHIPFLRAVHLHTSARGLDAEHGGVQKAGRVSVCRV